MKPTIPAPLYSDYIHVCIVHVCINSLTSALTNPNPNSDPNPNPNQHKISECVGIVGFKVTEYWGIGIMRSLETNFNAQNIGLSEYWAV